MYQSKTFWREALALNGSATLRVYPNVLIFGALSAVICSVVCLIEEWTSVRLELAVAPFEIVGAALGLLLILRTNAGYDRWWEARKIWGGIVNQSRNLAISGVAYGPDNQEWRASWVRWSATFSHIAKASLRQQPPSPEVAELLGPTGSQQIANSAHMPSYVALKLAALLNHACTEHGLDRFAFMQIDKERARLIDHIGACERILKTPLAKAYSIKIRRFLLLFLATLPFVLLQRMPTELLIPPFCMLLAYPLLALDCIGDQLQNPFSETNLSHLPLNDIASTIELNVTALPNEVGQTANVAEPHRLTVESGAPANLTAQSASNGCAPVPANT